MGVNHSVLVMRVGHLAVTFVEGKQKNGCTPFILSYSNEIFFLLITLLLSFHNVWGYDAEVNGIFYNLNTENYTATVTYKGSNPGEYYHEYAGNIVIPEKVTVDGTVYSVTSLGDWCFYYCMSLTSITIPSSVTSSSHFSADENRRRKEQTKEQ